MNDLSVIAFGMFAAIAPFGAVRTIEGYVNQPSSTSKLALEGPWAGATGLIAFVLFTFAAVAADLFLEIIDVSPENFQFAAGAIMIPFAVRLLWTGESMTHPDYSHEHALEPWLFPVAVPLLAGPASLTAALSYGARFGVEDVATAAIPVLAVSILLLTFCGSLCRALGYSGVGALGRFSGALLVIVAVELAVDGVRSV